MLLLAVIDTRVMAIEDDPHQDPLGINTIVSK